MRKLGLIGGMSWISTRAYYECINKHIRHYGEPMASAPMLIESLDYAPIFHARQSGDWDAIGTILSESARRLQDAGAQAIVISANTMYRTIDQLTDAVSIEVIHPADCVGAAVVDARAGRAALLGSRYVMTEDFYRQRLLAKGVELVDPDPGDVELVDGIIFKELMRGRVTRDAERALKTMITLKEKEGAKAIILACTELELVVDTDANVLPVFNSTDQHCRAAADWILS